MKSSVPWLLLSLLALLWVGSVEGQDAGSYRDTGDVSVQDVEDVGVVPDFPFVGPPMELPLCPEGFEAVQGQTVRAPPMPCRKRPGVYKRVEKQSSKMQGGLDSILESIKNRKKRRPPRVEQE